MEANRAFVVALALAVCATMNVGCGPSCEDLAEDTRRELVELSTGCTIDTDCRAVPTIAVVGAQLCAEPCVLVVRADVDDGTLRARFTPIAEDEDGCECVRPRCGPRRAVCEANRCVGIP